MAGVKKVALFSSMLLFGYFSLALALLPAKRKSSKDSCGESRLDKGGSGGPFEERKVDSLWIGRNERIRH